MLTQPGYCRGIARQKPRFRQIYALRDWNRPVCVNLKSTACRAVGGKVMVYERQIYGLSHTVQDGSRSNSHRCLRAILEFSTANAAARFAINLPARAAINRWYLRR
jgi:hypothetical protein